VRAALLALLALGGCADILGIHALGDAQVTSDDAPRDGGPGDGPMIDGTTDGMKLDGGATVQIGEYAMLSAATPISGNYIIARRFTVGSQSVITAAGAYLTSETANGHIKFGIYNDNATSPFTRRVISAADITLDGTAGYNEGPIGPHTLPAGTYWMVLATDAAIEIGSADTNNVTGAAASLPYASALPTTYSPQPGASTTSDRINLYLQVQP
jgi:hypothetical protein